MSNRLPATNGCWCTGDLAARRPHTSWLPAERCSAALPFALAPGAASAQAGDESFQTTLNDRPGGRGHRRGAALDRHQRPDRSARSPVRGHDRLPRHPLPGTRPVSFQGNLTGAGAGAAAGASLPRTIEIPAIGVRSDVNRVGLADDGSIAVPQPGPELDEAAWFENSQTPGQPGPSVIEGHVDSESGPSVFYELGRVRPGQKVIVTRADGRRLTFVVDAVRDYLKSRFPTRVVYGAEDLGEPALRLITCSRFDETTHHHIGNAVVFAHLSTVSPRRAPA